MKFLNKEYTKYHPDHKPWKNGLFLSAIVLSIFLLFQPFGFSDKDSELKLILFPVYALYGYFYSINSFFIVRHILKSKRIWTVKNELIYFTISILLVTFLILLLSSWFAGDLPLNLYWYFKMLFHVSSLFLIITVIEFLYYSNRSSDIKIEHLSSQVELVSRQLDNAKQALAFRGIETSIMQRLRPWTIVFFSQKPCVMR